MFWLLFVKVFGCSVCVGVLVFVGVVWVFVFWLLFE